MQSRRCSATLAATKGGTRRYHAFALSSTKPVEGGVFVHIFAVERSGFPCAAASTGLHRQVR